ncbi:MAG TPA: hypothetical protein DCE80_12705, partial [Ignavibacteriales bacterium]|nr:hypothetical protein [Ignavibacteriales bacterium]
MKNKITISTIVMFLFYSFATLAQTIKWEDRMNGDNSVAGLQARGWVILNEDGGGSSAPWFQGRVSVFTSFEGPDSGYVASNFNGANTNDVVDQWLISPILNINVGDSLSFLARSPDSSSFDDSIFVLLATNAGTTPSDFISLGRFLVSKNGWQQFYWISEINATIRVAIRYYLFDAQTNADYIGLDLIQVYTGATYPSTIAINKSFGFTNVTQSSSYRMIGLPGQTNFAIPITGTRKTDWNAFYDNGAATSYLVEYDGTANFNFNPGNGFWLLSKNTISVNAAVNTVTLAGDNTYSIPLHSGWNIISNPFERSTNWSAVQTANSLAGNSIIFDWGGTWTNPASFIPYKGYYFNNIGGLTSLKIPYDPGGTLGKTSIDNDFQIAVDDDIKLSLRAGNEEKSKVYIGFSSESTGDFDNEDFFAPPGDFEDARIVICNNNLSTNYKSLMKDSRSEIGEGQIYNLEIKNLTGEELTFKTEGISKYQEYLVYLVDERLNNGIIISDDIEITVAANVKANNYKFLIGTQQFIEVNKGNSSIPTEFALYQNYPNPFNPVTIIRFSVPCVGARCIVSVQLKLFDLLGNEIMTLLSEEKSPGNYEVELNASSVSRQIASGVSAKG